MQLVRFIACQVIELAGHATGRFVVRLLSGGAVRVQAPYSTTRETFRYHGFRRDADGTPAVSAEAQDLIGVATWVVLAVGTVLTVGRI